MSLLLKCIRYLTVVWRGLNAVLVLEPWVSPSWLIKAQLFSPQPSQPAESNLADGLTVLSPVVFGFCCCTYVIRRWRRILLYRPSGVSGCSSTSPSHQVAARGSHPAGHIPIQPVEWQWIQKMYACNVTLQWKRSSASWERWPISMPTPGNYPKSLTHSSPALWMFTETHKACLWDTRGITWVYFCWPAVVL